MPLAGFKLPEIVEGAHFGPPTDKLAESHEGLPTTSFNKSDRLGMIVDWSAPDKLTSGPSAYARRNFNVSGPTTSGEGVSSVASGFVGFGVGAEDEASFSVVDAGRTAGQRRSGPGQGYQNRPNFRSRGGGAGGRGAHGSGPGGRNQGRQGGGGGGAGRRGGNQMGFHGGNYRRDWNDRNQRNRNASVTVGNSWSLLEDIDLGRLQKLRLEVDANSAETLASYGFLYEYEKAFDRVNTKNEKPLLSIGRLRYNPTASEDPVLQDLSQTSRAQVFTTDLVLSALMCSPRSVLPWDLIITRENGKLFIDKREDGPFQYLSVNENSGDPPAETDDSNSINTQHALSQEATYINSVFTWQCVRESQDAKHSLDSPNPFYSVDETEPLASCGYLYRSFDLSVAEDELLEIVVRTEVDAQTDDQYLSIKTLFEFDSKAPGAGGAPDWRSKLDSQRGSAIATEMKNNSYKMARWAVQSIVAGAEQIKLGYISRANPRDQHRHTILGTHTFKARDLASQMSVNLSNGWGIVRAIIDFCMAQEDGKYVLMKDPNKPMLRLYQVPENAFDSEGELDGEDEADDLQSEY